MFLRYERATGNIARPYYSFLLASTVLFVYVVSFRSGGGGGALRQVPRDQGQYVCSPRGVWGSGEVRGHEHARFPVRSVR